MLRMLVKDGHVALKQEADDRWRWSHGTSCRKPAVWQNAERGGGIIASEDLALCYHNY